MVDQMGAKYSEDQIVIVEGKQGTIESVYEQWVQTYGQLRPVACIVEYDIRIGTELWQRVLEKYVTSPDDSPMLGGNK